MKTLDDRVRWGIIAFSIISFVLLAVAALKENAYPEWRQIRLEYAAMLHSAATDEREKEVAEKFEIAIGQNFLPELGAVDRCITCHAGVDDPRMASADQPFRTHPGTILLDHPTEQFGCTICHQGQGRATETDAAHGRVAHWLYPMFEKSYLYAACSKCHDEESLYREPGLLTESGGDTLSEGASLIARGRQLMEEQGCRGCHKVNGLGGDLGPDITFVGDKTHHEFDFAHFEAHEPREASYWLKRHFLEPGVVSPETSMPNMHFSQEDAKALTAFTLSLRRRAIPPVYIDHRIDLQPEPEPLTGEELYKTLCAACHGQDGEGGDVPGASAPILNNPDTLAMATDNYYRHSIDKGRSKTLMPAWGPESGNLSYEQIDRIVEYIRGWQDEGADLTKVSSEYGKSRAGREHYERLCGNCHGTNGEGGIGNTLNSLTFLAAASDRFLAQSIISGRPGTAMASWKHLPAQTISDLLAYLRTWQGVPPTFKKVQARFESQPKEALVERGSGLFYEHCAVCHGINGEGAIGPRLNNAQFLQIVDNRYLYRAITQGRPSTAMPAWRHLTADQIAALLEYINSWGNGESLSFGNEAANGDPALGEGFYNIACVDCHGERAQGKTGPQLSNPVFLSAVSDSMFPHLACGGHPGSDRHTFPSSAGGSVELTTAQLDHVVAYLRLLAASDDIVIPRASHGDPEKGEEVYLETCALCHGERGDFPVGPQLNNPTFLRSVSDGFLKATIALGRSDTEMQPMIDPEEGMSEVTAENVQDIIAFMREWETPTEGWDLRAIVSSREKTIDAGREKYMRHCAECHGDEGRGKQGELDDFAPSLNNPEFLDAASDSFLLATIARGRSNTRMMPFGIGAGGDASLDSKSIREIVAYIRSWRQRYIPDDPA